MTNWYHLPHKTALGLILIILRSSIVIKITAGKIFHMSIATFGVVSILKILDILQLLSINYKYLFAALFFITDMQTYERINNI